MITFITDVRPGETNILTSIRYSRLLVTSLEGEVLGSLPAPQQGWTTESLNFGNMFDYPLSLYCPH